MPGLKLEMVVLTATLPSMAIIVCLVRLTSIHFSPVTAGTYDGGWGVGCFVTGVLRMVAPPALGTVSR